MLLIRTRLKGQILLLWGRNRVTISSFKPRKTESMRLRGRGLRSCGKGSSMPWIKFLEEPYILGERIVRSYYDGNPMEVTKLENVRKEDGSEWDPPLVKPADKKTEDWNIGDHGELLAYRQDGSHLYYKFEVVDSPWPNLRRQGSQSQKSQEDHSQ